MWQLAPGQALRIRQFGDESVLYNDLSGDTHLLGGSAVHVLGVLRHGRASRRQLLDSLADALGRRRDAGFDSEAGAVLDQLAAFFLIERAAC